jgi:hypothetical protein
LLWIIPALDLNGLKAAATPFAIGREEGWREDPDFLEPPSAPPFRHSGVMVMLGSESPACSSLNIKRVMLWIRIQTSDPKLKLAIMDGIRFQTLPILKNTGTIVSYLITFLLFPYKSEDKSGYRC